MPEMFMTVNPLNLIGLIEINPRLPLCVYQIPLRAGEVFDVDILATVSARDMSPQTLHVRLDVEKLKRGVLVRGGALTKDESDEVLHKLSVPRVFTRPRPTRPLSIELLGQIEANSDESARGLTLIRREHPSDPSLVCVIPSSRPSGQTLEYEKDSAFAAIQELQELGWLGNPSSNRAVHIYKTIPEA